MFEPLVTSRLVVRPFTSADAEALFARRNDPEVARLQNWVTPFPRERVDEIIDELVAMDGPEPGEWWMAIISDRITEEVYGDLALHISEDSHTAEVGYTLDARHWGNGYTTEALDSLIGYLFDGLAVTRVFGMLHPDNRASAMVLERTGFLYEGRTRSSFWLEGEVSDDLIYGLTRPDWETWRDRPRHPPQEVRLVEVNLDNVSSVYRLATHKSQEEFVSPMPETFTDALFPEIVDGAPTVPWMRAVLADDALAGFVMLAITTEHHPEPYLWRLLVDRMHQRRGIGGRILGLIEGECIRMGDRTLVTSWHEGKGSPRPFYLANGFVPTGRLVDGETEGRKQLG